MTTCSARWLWTTAALAPFAAVGCDVSRAEPQGPSAGADSAVTSPASPTGAIHGRVTWQGELPDVPPFHVRGNPLAPGTFARRGDWPNPNAPPINPATRGVGGALVFLRGDFPSADAWPHAPPRVELVDKQIQILQGAQPTAVGFVRRGDGVEFLSRDDVFHSVQARGASFFALSLPAPGYPARRTLRHAGIVELESGAGYYWMRGHLFVADHPYCVLADSEGRFRLGQVPAGEYEIACWLPDWRVARRERDPETGVVSRLAFRPPLEQTRMIVVPAEGAAAVDFILAASPGQVDPR